MEENSPFSRYSGYCTSGKSRRKGKGPVKQAGYPNSALRYPAGLGVVKGKGFTIAIPKGWRKLPMTIGHHVLYVNGDGIGAAMTDETGAPIQIGLAVEKYSKTKDSALNGAKRNLASVERNPRLKVMSQGKVKPVKLSDGTEAAFFRVLMFKDRTRKSLYQKIFAKDKDSRGWVVSAWIVTGKDSKFIAGNKSLEKWLLAHVTSLCFEREKFDAAALRAAYSPAQTKPATSSRPTTTSSPTRKPE